MIITTAIKMTEITEQDATNKYHVSGQYSVQLPWKCKNCTAQPLCRIIFHYIFMIFVHFITMPVFLLERHLAGFLLQHVPCTAVHFLWLGVVTPPWLHRAPKNNLFKQVWKRAKLSEFFLLVHLRVGVEPVMHNGVIWTAIRLLLFIGQSHALVVASFSPMRWTCCLQAKKTRKTLKVMRD